MDKVRRRARSVGIEEIFMEIISEIVMNIKGELLCMVVLGMILLKLFQSGDNRYIDQMFRCIVLCCVAFITSFALRSLIDSGVVYATPTFTFWTNVFYFIFLQVLILGWFFYSETVQESWVVKSKLRCFVCSLPVVVFAVITILSNYTGWIFYVDEHSVYHRGNLYLLQYLIPMVYALFTSGKALYLLLKNKNYEKQDELKVLTLFPIPIFITAIFQLFFPESLSLSIGFPLGTLLVYMDIQDSKISLDTMTQLNNRGQLVRHLSGKMKNHDGEMPLNLIIIDVNRFKSINDRYGHVEGDLALIRVANALKQSVTKDQGFIARYGGDEFIIVTEGDVAQVNALCKTIEQNLARLNGEAGAPYSLTVSIGYAEYSNDITDIPSFIHAADKRLYQEKRAGRRY